MFRGAVIAGILIGLSGIAALGISNPIVSSGIVTFGLVIVALLGYPLFTYASGSVNFFDTYFKNWHVLSWANLELVYGEVLIGNLLGCFLVSLIARFGINSGILCEVSGEILRSRLEAGFLECSISAIGCGIIIDFSKYCWDKAKNILPIIIGSLGISLLGLPHCVHEGFYYMCSPDVPFLDILLLFPGIVIGNYIGCRIRRLIN